MNSEEFKTSEEVRDNWDKKREEYWSKKAKLSTTLKDIFTTQSNEGVRFSLRLNKEEYEVLRQAVMKNNVLYGKNNLIETAYTANYLYIYYNYGDDSFSPIKRLKIKGNEDLIKLIVEGIKYETNGNRTSIDTFIANARRKRKQHNRSNSNASRRRGSNGGVGNMDIRQQANADGNNGESNSNEQGITPYDSEAGVNFRLVEDEDLLAKLNSEPTIKTYRAMVLIDGKLYPPMSSKANGKLREPSEIGAWEEAEEKPELADNKGYFKLDKGNKTSLKVRYNPYFHTSRTPLNDQFSSAQDRPELVTVEVEVPLSELTSGYKAEKAKDAVGELEWKAGVVQGKLSGTRKVILSRWSKPVRIVPDSEVAQRIVEMFGDREITMPSNVVTPSLRAELEKLGVPFVETDNQGKPTETRFRLSEEASNILDTMGQRNEEAYNSVTRVELPEAVTPMEIARNKKMGVRFRLFTPDQDFAINNLVTETANLKKELDTIMNSEEFKTSEEVRDNWDKKREEYWSKKAKLSTTLKDIFTTESNEGVRFSLGEKEVNNVIISSKGGFKLPKNRQEAFEYIPANGIVFDNKDQNVGIKVSRKTVKHSSLHNNADEYAIFSSMKEVIGNAVKIGNIPVAEDEIGHTRSVSVFYVPININGTQYSGRLLVKELENKGVVLDDLSLYNASLHKEKGSAIQPLNASKEVGGASPQNHYLFTK